VIAYIGFLRVSDDSLAQPSKDWTSEVAKYATGKAASDTIDAAAQFAAEGVHSVGHATVATAVTNVSTGRVGLRGCVDTSGVDIRDTKGNSIRANSGPGAYWRYIETAEVVLVGNTWKVSAFSPDAATSC
jgi:hypothetical protein